MPKIVDHDEQRRSLSATVVSLIAEVGLEHTTLRSVADAHGCTKGMVQHYFANKEELLLGALNYVEDCCEERMMSFQDKYEGLELLEKRLQSILPLKDVLRDEWSVRIAFSTRAYVSEDMRQELSERYQQQVKEGVKLLKQADKKKKLGRGLNLKNTYRSLLALVNGMGMSAVMDPKQLSGAAQKQILSDAIVTIKR